MSTHLPCYNLFLKKLIIQRKRCDKLSNCAFEMGIKKQVLTLCTCSTINISQIAQFIHNESFIKTTLLAIIVVLLKYLRKINWTTHYFSWKKIIYLKYLENKRS